jgi:hypothetical protein
LPLLIFNANLFLETNMDQLENRNRPYALKAGEGWTYRFGIDFTVTASEVQKGSGAAIADGWDAPRF